MIKVRLSYTNDQEVEQFIDDIKKDNDILSLNKEHKSKNPKYADSKYKIAYLEVERRK